MSWLRTSMSFSNAAGKCVACMHMLKLGWEWESAMTTVICQSQPWRRQALQPPGSLASAGQQYSSMTTGPSCTLARQQEGAPCKLTCLCQQSMWRRHLPIPPSLGKDFTVPCPSSTCFLGSQMSLSHIHSRHFANCYVSFFTSVSQGGWDHMWVV